MKGADSSKHRQAVKNIQCKKKLFKSHLHSSKLGKTVEKHATSTNQKMAGHQQGKPSCLLIVVKAKMKSAFLLWHHHGDTNMAFQLKPVKFSVTQTTFMIV